LTTLTDLGWRPHFQHQLLPADSGPDRLLARVATEHKDRYRLIAPEGLLAAELSGRLRHQTLSRVDLPAVGDWVVARRRPDDPNAALIQRVLTRQTQFSRKQCGGPDGEQIVAANVDTLFLVSSFNQDLNPRRLERYLATAWQSGARPVVLLNKADLCPDRESGLAQIRAVAREVPIHLLSAQTGEGLEQLAIYHEAGQTSAMLGSSGVGKSTLINRLAGEALQAVGEIRDDDAKGRHTTTSRELIPLPQGGLIIDTPGMRELHLWEADSGLDQTFADITALTQSCVFRNCSHGAEPDCAIAAALAAGRLDRTRYESYQKLQRELAFQALKQDPVAAREQKHQRRKFAKQVRKRLRSGEQW